MPGIMHGQAQAQRSPLGVCPLSNPGFSGEKVDPGAIYPYPVRLLACL